MDGSAHILIADADPLARRYLRSLLSASGGAQTFAEAEDFSSASDFLRDNPEVTLGLIDIDLPGMTGEVGLRYLALHHRTTRFAVFFSKMAVETIAQLMATGIAGCVPRDLSEEAMSSALATIVRGSTYTPQPPDEPKPAQPVDQQSDFLRHELTDRQIQVLRLLALGHSNREIAEILNIAEGTVKVHVNATFRVLGVHNRVTAAAALQKHLHSAAEDKEESSRPD